MIAARGHALGMAGRHEEAREVLRQLETLSRERYVSPYQFAVVELGLGNRRGALQQVLKAWDDRSLWIPWLRGDPRLDPIRAEPEFQKLLQQSGAERHQALAHLAKQMTRRIGTLESPIPGHPRPS